LTEYVPLEDPVPTTVMCELSTTTAMTVPVIPVEVTVAPAWKPDPVRVNWNVLLARAQAGDTVDGLVIAGTDCGFTVRTKFCVTPGPDIFVAVRVIGKLPEIVGVPASVALPFPLSVNVTPFGSAPVSVKAGLGNPAAEIVKDIASLIGAVSLAAVANTGVEGAAATSRVNVCETELAAFWAPMVNMSVSPVNGGVPLSVAVPLWLSVNVAHNGIPVWAKEMGELPDVVMVKGVIGIPGTMVSLLALVMAGAWSTVTVKLWSAWAPPLAAFEALMAKVNEWPIAEDGALKYSAPFPPPLSTNIAHEGQPDPVSDSAGEGEPEALTANELGTPATIVSEKTPPAKAGGAAGEGSKFGSDTTKSTLVFVPVFVFVAVAVSCCCGDGVVVESQGATPSLPLTSNWFLLESQTSTCVTLTV
jgi:hypothetical protein